MTRWRSIAGTVMCGFFVWASPADADVVVDWNLITFQTAPATRAQAVSSITPWSMSPCTTQSRRSSNVTSSMVYR